MSPEPYFDEVNARIQEIIDDLSNEIIKLVEEYKQTKKLFDSLSPRSSLILSERYLKGKTWEQIAEILNLTTRQVYRLHNKVLEEVGEDYRIVIPEEEETQKGGVDGSFKESKT
ncbi:hypothetical protein P261_00507 [Lachnospiraceae bacterium TWA4]|nr:hypothetical protein P261_00507 [Lachnospiraceae bacterium TWA4]